MSVLSSRQQQESIKLMKRATRFEMKCGNISSPIGTLSRLYNTSQEPEGSSIDSTSNVNS